MTTQNEQQVASRIGRERGQLIFNLMAQELKHPAKLELRKWLSANGVASTFAAKLSFNALEQAWNDTTNKALNDIRAASRGDAGAAQAIQHEEQETVTTNTQSNTADPLAGLLAYIEQRIGGTVNENKVRDIVREHVHVFEDMLPELIAKHSPVKTIEIKQGELVTAKIDGHVHPKFEVLLKAASSRQANGRHPNIMLKGPTGSGKTHAVEMLAKALGLEFYTNGAISMDHQLLGFKDAAGNYHETPFRKAFGRAAVYLFDEIDGSDNSPLLSLAGALANGGSEFPDAFVDRHPDSIIIAAGNTWGNGATADFVGRNKLDGMIKSRFPVKIDWGYDEELERNICGNPAWAKRVQKARANAAKAGVKVQIDPRMSQAGAALIAAGMSFEEAAEMTYLAELTKDQRKMVDAA